MSPYYFPISRAAVTFPLVAALFTFPYVVHSYRKYGAVSLWRSFLLFSFIFYLQCAYYLVILPLPDPMTVSQRTGPFYDLFPFTFVKTFFQESPLILTSPSTWIPAFTHRSFLEPLFNVLLLVPFGFYLAYYFKMKWKKVLIFSFFLSLFFEISQLTGLYGLYSKPYRLFSVDDLLLNTLGGLVGYLIYAKLLFLWPKLEKSDQKTKERGQRVSFTRRTFAYLLDGVLISILQRVLEAMTVIRQPYSFGIVLSVYTVCFAVLTRGRTPGKAIVRLKVTQREPNRRPYLYITLRYLLRNIMLFCCSFLSIQIGNSEDWQIFWLILFLAIILAQLIDCLCSRRKNRWLWYERLTRTENVSTLKVSA